MAHGCHVPQEIGFNGLRGSEQLGCGIVRIEEFVGNRRKAQRYYRYQRTHNTTIFRSECRPLNSSWTGTDAVELPRNAETDREAGNWHAFQTANMTSQSRAQRNIVRAFASAS